MIDRLLKSVPLVLAMLAMTMGYSAYNSQAQDKKQDKFGYDQGHAVDEHEMMSAYNSPARIDVTGAWDFFISASFIYWQPSMQGLDLGLRQAAAPGSQTNAQGDVINMDWDYEPGFKVALGINFEHDNWELMAEYTWLYGDETSAKSEISTARGIVPAWRTSGNGTDTYVTRAEGKWSLHTHLIDLELARPYYVGTKLTFRPFFGLRGVIIDQDFTASYGDQTTGQTNSANLDQDTWGVGFRTGLDANYIFGAGFRFFGAAAFSLFYQDFDVTYKDERNNNASLYYSNYKNDYETITANPELRLGFGWGTYFADNAWHFDIEASYDFQIFFNQNMMRNLVEKVNNARMGGSTGDLFYQGGTVTLRFDF